MSFDDQQGFENELKEILAVSNRIEEALGRVASHDFRERLLGLLAFSDLEPSLNEIAEHCQAQGGKAAASFRDDLNGAENLRMSSEHTEIRTLLGRFRQELDAATADAAAAIILPGLKLVRQIRAHIEYDEEVLERLEEPEPVTEEVLLRYTESPD